MKALVFGSLNIDLVFSVDHTVLPGETINSLGLEKSAGGKGANQAAALAKAGMEVAMAGKIGRDGLFLLDLLASFGVDTSRVALYEGATGQALIQVDKKGQNAIVLYPGGNHRITGEEAEAAFKDFGQGDIIVLQNEILLTAEIMRKARSRGLRVCLNPSPYDRGVESLPLDLADLLFLNEIEGAALASLEPETPAREILEALTGRFPESEIILTAGREGAYYGYKDRREKGDILDLPVADTTGAGDTFTGYYIAARAGGSSVKEALRLACKAASIAVSRKGAMAAIPLKNEVF
ncbi:MAG: ribokinase [Treponema sp.]|jgi:ribokinase|nr:ribokinase [Treponema sp.]